MAEKEEQKLTIDTTLGKITGKVVDIGDQKVCQFLGIPYAKQPIGKLRFQPLEPLDDKLDAEQSPFEALQHGKVAMQEVGINFMSTKHPISEECINLNICVNITGKDISSGMLSLVDENKPVLFHIHGGGFILASGSEPYFDVTNTVAKQDVVGVNINYRLNSFGFLSCPPAIEHNLGLLDQQFALKWVNSHITQFGGCADNVTLLGCSAGGASVHWHMLQEESCKYFARAISLSGVLNPFWCHTPRDKQSSKVTATLKKLGCPIENPSPDQVKEFLQSLTTEQIHSVHPTEPTDENQFVPVNAFDCEQPSKQFIAHNKPLILGITAEEGKFFPDFLFPRKDKSQPTKAREAFAEIFSEQFFFSPLRKLLEELRQVPECPLYVYIYDYSMQGRGNLFSESDMPLHYGKCHAMDLSFMLNFLSADSSSFSSTPSDIRVNEIFQGILGHFLKGDEDKMGLVRYEASEQVNRIRESGIDHVDKSCLQLNNKMLTFKTVALATLLKTFPNSF